jgi:CheY-like chemotaxis protein
MDGYTVVQALRQDPDLATARIAVLTGYDEESARGKAIAARLDA